MQFGICSRGLALRDLKKEGTYKYCIAIILDCCLKHKMITFNLNHDDVMKWKHFPRYWPFVREIHRSPLTSPHKGQWRGASMFSLICVWINCWVNNREAGDLRRHRVLYDVIVMSFWMTLGTKVQYLSDIYTHQLIISTIFCGQYILSISKRKLFVFCNICPLYKNYRFTCGKF